MMDESINQSKASNAGHCPREFMWETKWALAHRTYVIKRATDRRTIGKDLKMIEIELSVTAAE
jgi:hypothetical protein